MLIRITNDVFDIAARAKEINKDYEIRFDTERQKFILMRNRQVELVFPFEELDPRAISYIIETRIENLDEIIKKVDKHNADLDKNAVSDMQDEVENEVSRAFRLNKI